MKKSKASKNLSSLCLRLKKEIEALDNLPSTQEQDAEKKRQQLYQELKKQLAEFSETHD